MEFVGILPIGKLLKRDSLKQESLIFDRVAIVNYESVLRLIKEIGGKGANSYINELEYLRETGFILNIEGDYNDERLNANDDYRKYSNLFKHHINEWSKVTQAYAPDLPPRKIWDDNLYHLDLAGAYQGRVKSVQLRLINEYDAYPILENLSSLEQTKDIKSDVLRIVLKALPTPDESTSWEQIREYRSDSDSKSSFLALRNWMNESARTNLNPIEIGQKLEYLIHQYQRHMKLHRMKVNSSALETIVMSGAEILENLVRFKFSKMIEPLFILHHRRIALMEAELNAPGNEVAYIIKTNETFSR